MKKTKILGKGIPVFAIAILGLALVSAALLSYYGTITGNVVAEQSVFVDGGNYQAVIEDKVWEASPGGERFCFKHKLENKASVPAIIELVNSCSARDLNNRVINCEGADKTHYVMPDEVTLELCSKDAGWNCDGRMNATLIFDPVNPTFKGKLTTTGLTSGTPYALIYYADKEPDRFVNWGGDNPGKVILTFTGEQTNWDFEVDIGMNLPTAPDTNLNTGAKLWIVPISALTGDNALPMDEWNSSEYLFEKEFIVYFDCDLGIPSNYPVGKYTPYVEETNITIKSNETIDFINCYEFAINIMPGTYKFETKVVPVIA